MSSQDIRIAKEVLRLRLSQMLINERYKTGAFKIPVHLAMGHEAIAVALSAVMESEDVLACSHRNVHYNLARAGSLRPILAEYLLKKDGLAGAELGSMNLANPEKNLVYTSSILGNDLPIATGLALGEKVRGTGGFTIVVTGDGAMEEGSFYESVLFMNSNSLPVLLIVENNTWSMHTQVHERRTQIDVQGFAGSLGAQYAKFAGNDVYAYIEELKKFRGQILKNNSPLVLEVDLMTLGGWHVEEGEAKTKRFIHPHAGALPPVEIKEWPVLEESANDPVFVLKSNFSEDDLKSASKEMLTALNEEISGI